MKLLRLVSLSLIILIFLNCSSEKKEIEKLFSQLNKYAKYKDGDSYKILFPNSFTQSWFVPGMTAEKGAKSMSIQLKKTLCELFSTSEKAGMTEYLKSKLGSGNVMLTSAIDIILPHC